MHFGLIVMPKVTNGRVANLAFLLTRPADRRRDLSKTPLVASLCLDSGPGGEHIHGGLGCRCPNQMGLERDTRCCVSCLA